MDTSSVRDLWWLGDRQVLSFPAPRWGAWSTAGWAAYFSDVTEDSSLQVLVRFGMRPQRDGVPVSAPSVRDVVVRACGDGAVNGVIMRDLPIARMEAAAAARPVVVNAGDYPWVSSGAAPPARPGRDELWTLFPGWEHRAGGLSLALEVPEGQKRPDGFYADVADRYRRLSVRARRPAEELAAANGVPVTTVHRWIKEARRRGIMPPGQRGPGRG